MKSRNKSKKHNLVGEMALKTVQKFYPECEWVEDAEPKDFRPFNLTRGDYVGAVRKDPMECAVSHACKREFGAYGSVTGRRTLYLLFKTKGHVFARRYALHQPERQAVGIYDGGGEICGAFVLSPPDEARRLGSPYTGKSHNPSKRARPSMRKGTPNEIAQIREALSSKEWGAKRKQKAKAA